MRYIAVALVMLLWSSYSAAQDNATAEVEYNAFGVPNQVVRSISANSSEPNSRTIEIDCNNVELLNQVRQKINSLQTEEENIVKHRRRLLALKHIEKFSHLSVKDFVPKDNYRVANRIITIKINNGLKDEDLQLCVSSNPILSRKVYLLIYTLEDKKYVEIINYTAPSSSEEPFIIYEK